MSRFTREVYPVVVVASVGTSTADWGIDTSGKLILNQITSSTMAGMATSTAPAYLTCLLYTSPSPRDRQKSRMPSSA